MGALCIVAGWEVRRDKESFELLDAHEVHSGRPLNLQMKSAVRCGCGQ